MAEHLAPRPWKIADATDLKHLCWLVVDDEGQIVLRIYNRALAELIVEAVNAHAKRETAHG